MNILVVGGLGHFSEKILALCRDGYSLVYGYTQEWEALSPHEIGRIKRASEEHNNGQVFVKAIDPKNSVASVKELIKQYDSELVLGAMHFFDGSNELLFDLLSAKLQLPIVRSYQEHKCQVSPVEKRVLEESDGHIYQNLAHYNYFKKNYDLNKETALFCDLEALPSALMPTTLLPKLNESLAGPHLVIAGGVSADGGRYDYQAFIIEMANRGVHTHIYGRFTKWNIHYQPELCDEVKAKYLLLSQSYPQIHIHDRVNAEIASLMWSQYDAGVLHMEPQKIPARFKKFLSDAEKFNQLNYPHRTGHYVSAGLPIILKKGTMDAMEQFLEANQIGVFYDDYDELATKLHDFDRVNELSHNAMCLRRNLSFEASAPKVLDFLDHIKQLSSKR